MADLIRSAKQDSEWTQHEIHAFNIELIQTVDVPSFFNITELPTAAVSDVILNNVVDIIALPWSLERAMGWDGCPLNFRVC
ncbi:hypothetical protein BJ912DRAFT_137102 [Pholiota molesta]|nr:hypothetical protein BJ912DRAFT_137102 [Pholiota molesta]